MKLGLPQFSYTKGLHELGSGCYAYLQPDGSWGWSNAGLITDGNHALLVDTLYDFDLTKDMLAAINKQVPGAASGIKTIVNTHSNGDHCNGNALVGASEIIASKGAAASMVYESPAMMMEMLNNADKMGDVGKYFRQCFGKFKFDQVERSLPTIQFEGSMQRSVGGKKVELIEVGPAHTAGDVIVHVVDCGIVFSGDILFIEGHPLMWAGPVRNWIKACQLILDLNPKIVVPGHGPITDRSGVIAVKEYFEYVASESRKYFDKGANIIEAAATMLKGPYSSWIDGERMAANVAMMYREFKGETTPVNMVELFGLMAKLALSLPTPSTKATR
jgi:glyoxylase-like metal-dependent hydrolase (beta-lactamase superfamily II)